MKNFQRTEKMLINSLIRIVIRGKRGHVGPVLITSDIEQHFEIIFKFRNAVRKQSKYPFGKSKTCQPIVQYKLM